MTAGAPAGAHAPGMREPGIRGAPTGRIELRGLTHRYGATTGLDGVDLDIPAGSFTVLVGPSGSGKSTVLQVIAGLLTPTAGTVTLDGADVTRDPVGTRDLALVFQDYALYPHMTVAANVGFALRLDVRHRRRRMDRAALDAAVTEVCERLEIADLLDRRPGQLSGGQRQRVAIARALVRRPAVLLLDEPLAAVDAQLRHRTRAELLRLHRELRSTIVLVTHDQNDALSLADHLVLLDRGRCVQAGPPDRLYRSPATTFAARFLGEPPVNLREAARIDPTGPARELIGWRPHDAVADPAGAESDHLHARPDSDHVRLAGTVDVVEYTGTGRILHCTDQHGTWSVVVSGEDTAWRPGQDIVVHVPRRRLLRFDAASGRVRPRGHPPDATDPIGDTGSHSDGAAC